MGPISVCLSAGDKDHRETYMDQTQMGPLNTMLSILTREKLLSSRSLGKDLIAVQLVTARVIDRMCTWSQQQTFPSQNQVPSTII